jgi:hypothetical protein
MASVGDRWAGMGPRSRPGIPGREERPFGSGGAVPATMHGYSVPSLSLARQLNLLHICMSCRAGHVAAGLSVIAASAFGGMRAARHVRPRGPAAAVA